MRIGVLSSPWRWLSDAIEFRRLRRRLPNVHRAWSRASGKLRPESDAEYLVRLRSLAREREHLRDSQNAPADPTTARSSDGWFSRGPHIHRQREHRQTTIRGGGMRLLTAVVMAACFCV